MRGISKVGLDLIKKSENDKDPRAGYRLKDNIPYYIPYIDPVGVCTIGYGTIMYQNGDMVAIHDPQITEEKALEFLHHDIGVKSKVIERFCTNNKVSLNDTQFSAIVSLVYNCGIGAVINQGCSMRNALISGNNADIARAFRLWVKGTVGKGIFKRKATLPGLVTRREAEIKLFFS